MINQLIITFSLTITAVVSAQASACSLMGTEAIKVKEKLASAIADEIGVEATDIDLGKITEPELHMPLGLGADCSGLGAFHHTAGFRLEHSGCTFEGVAVLLGHWYTNPVAVHTQKTCG